jgi:hypothetical protein
VVGSGQDDQSFWKILWKMKVPPKVWNYWWRVIKGFIPCRAVLERRHIEKIAFCQTSGSVKTTFFV